MAPSTASRMAFRLPTLSALSIFASTPMLAPAPPRREPIASEGHGQFVCYGFSLDMHSLQCVPSIDYSVNLTPFGLLANRHVMEDLALFATPITLCTS